LKYALNKNEDALIVVDVQIDFCPGGALPTPEGHRVVPILNGYIKKFNEAEALIVATRDWHPPNHISFKAYGGVWHPHCVQGTKGAEFHPNLALPKKTKIVSKAADPVKEAYSGFDGTRLGEQLKDMGIKRVFVSGLATDYCVKKTVTDALKLGFETILLKDAVRGIDVKSGDSENAIKEMLKKGAKNTTLANLE